MPFLTPLEKNVQEITCLHIAQQVAAMASKVGPSVATAAAKAALAALCDEASCPKEIFDTDDYSNFTVDRFDSLSPQFACGLASQVLH